MNTSLNKTNIVAITGASGLLGRFLCDYFIEKGWTVNALVRDVSTYPFKNKGIKLFSCILPDTVDSEAMESADVVIHCAYMTRFTNIEDARRVNEDGMRKVLSEARSAGVKRFVFISTRAARPNAQSYYARSKYRLESMLDQSKDLIIRPGLILASDGGLFYRIVHQVKRLPVVPVFGGGEQKLNTVHVEDLCKVIDWALEKNVCGIMTVAESDGITMKELLKTVLKEQGQTKLIVSIPGKPILWLLQLLEKLNLKLPVSSENLRGLLNRDEIESCSPINLSQTGLHIRGSRESIKSLVQKT